METGQIYRESEAVVSTDLPENVKNNGSHQSGYEYMYMGIHSRENSNVFLLNPNLQFYLAI